MSAGRDRTPPSSTSRGGSGRRPPTRQGGAARGGGTSRGGGPARATRPPAKGAPGRGRARTSRSTGLRRLAVLLLVVCGIAALAYAVARPRLEKAVTEISLPLRHEDIIRQQAREKGLDPALVAGVIYAESRFRDNQESPAGALGLMQVTPDTARDIARESGANAFQIGDLHTADVNIRYGTWRLRDMLRRFDGDLTLAIAAYNAGPENAKRWRATAAANGGRVTSSTITFPETRQYVQRVLSARDDYRKRYARELGL